MEKLTDGPLQKGARYRGKFKGFGTVEFEYAEYEPDRRFAHVARMKLGEMRHTWIFEPADGGTRLTQIGELVRPNLLGRIMGPVMRNQLAKRFRSIASELQRYLTAGSAG